MSIFNFNDQDAIGIVFSVDTANVLVEVTDEDRLRSVQVNHLVVLRSSNAGQHLLGVIDKISRKAVVETIEDDEEDTSKDTIVVENFVRVTLIGTLIDAVGTKKDVFRRTLETVPEIAAACFPLEGESLSAFMQAISKPEDGVNSLGLGVYTLDDTAEACLDGNKFFQRHAVIVGSTGSGKSWTVAHLVEQIAELTNANAILFDIHGEYAPLNGKGIQHLRVAGPGDLSNDSSLDDGVLFLPHWLLTYEEMLAMILDRSDQNAPNQAMVFSREVITAKRNLLEKLEKGDVLANFTIDSPVPYELCDVLERLKFADTERVPGAKKDSTKAGDFNGKLSRFIQRLEAKIGDRRLGFLFSAPKSSMTYEWMPSLCRRLLGSSEQEEGGGVKIIDFSEVPSDVLPLILGLVARLVFSVQQWVDESKRHPITLICDEAHLYIQTRTEANAVGEAALNNFERIAKEGRKYGVGLVVVSQRPSEVSRTVLSQCNNFIAMRLTNAEDQQVIRRLLPDTLGGFTDLLPILDIGEALVVGDASLLPSRIRIQKPRTQPHSATVDFWTKWAKTGVDSGIVAAVESMRRQTKQT